MRNGTRAKTVLTEATGHLEIGVPRDRDGTFELVIVKKHQRRLIGLHEMVLSLYAHGLTTGEISAHFAQIYGAQVSKETISKNRGHGVRGDGGLGEPAPGRRVRGDLHRRDGVLTVSKSESVKYRQRKITVGMPLWGQKVRVTEAKDFVAVHLVDGERLLRELVDLGPVGTYHGGGTRGRPKKTPTAAPPAPSKDRV